MDRDLIQTCVITSTFGPPNTSSISPSCFLRKGSRKFPNSSKSTGPFERPTATLKPPVPFRDEAPVMGLVTCKNFINANAAEVIIMSPPSPKEGDVNYLEKSDYGQVPAYLSAIKETISREKALIDELVQKKTKGDSLDDDHSAEYEIMNEEERQHLIERLKEKWDLVNSKYQKICHRVTIDSLGDIRRKEFQERELQQLEDDIEKLSRPGPLLIKKV